MGEEFTVLNRLHYEGVNICRKVKSKLETAPAALDRNAMITMQRFLLRVPFRTLKVAQQTENTSKHKKKNSKGTTRTELTTKGRKLKTGGGFQSQGAVQLNALAPVVLRREMGTDSRPAVHREWEEVHSSRSERWEWGGGSLWSVLSQTGRQWSSVMKRVI